MTLDVLEAAARRTGAGLAAAVARFEALRSGDEPARTGGAGRWRRRGGRDLRKRADVACPAATASGPGTRGRSPPGGVGRRTREYLLEAWSTASTSPPAPNRSS